MLRQVHRRGECPSGLGDFLSTIYEDDIDRILIGVIFYWFSLTISRFDRPNGLVKESVETVARTFESSENRWTLKKRWSFFCWLVMILQHRKHWQVEIACMYLYFNWFPFVFLLDLLPYSTYFRESQLAKVCGAVKSWLIKKNRWYFFWNLSIFVGLKRPSNRFHWFLHQNFCPGKTWDCLKNIVKSYTN